MNQTVYQPPMAPPQHAVTYAGFWKRFAAYLIDKIVISVGAGIILVPFMIFFGLGIAFNIEEMETDPGMFIAFIGAYFMLIVVLLGLQWIYFALMESKKGATLGKMALGIKVTDMSGNPVSFARASGRYFGKILSGLTLGIGYIIAGFSQQKQALHDILAKTLVVNKYY
ncbi:MAG TPA: RDD family protein [Bacteroidota bacterium]|nr:RDD family protein [Bacteroidota bacterium]